MALLFSLNRVNRLFQWIFSQCLNNFDNLLDRSDHDNLCVIGEDNESHRKDEARENCCAKLHLGLLSDSVGVVYPSVSH